ncbi:VWA domain-containing protein [Corynebacterium sp. 335C]
MLPEFAHPWWLLGVVAAAALAMAYVVATRRRGRRALAFGNLPALARVAPAGRPWLRHIAPAATLVALATASTALAGPVTETQVARNRATVMLVVDVSLSMAATDVAPDRLTAAKQAGAEFIGMLPDDLNLGLVTFAGSTRTPVPPTTDHDTVARALDGAALDQATATGDAILAALDAVTSFGERVRSEQGPPPATIVLLSDGKQTIPAELDDPRGAYSAADEAASRGVPVNTISFGTPGGTIVVEDQVLPVPTDDESLREIARRSGGGFHSAGSLEELREAYAGLAEDIGTETRRAENPRPWMLATAAALLIAAGGALGESRRVP